MADITLKLIWYKLGETRAKMADWYDNLNWEDHILDILLFGWIAWSALLVILANGLSKVISPLRLRAIRDRVRESSGGGSRARVISGTESCQWFNHGVSWFYLNYHKQCNFIDSWINTLNIEVKKLGGPVHIKFEKVESGSLPPKFTDISSQIGQDDKFTVQGHVESRDLAFVVFASQTTSEGVKLTNCTAKVLRLKGKVRATVEKIRGEVKVTAAFDGKPEIKTSVKPSNPFQEKDELVDLGVVDEVVRNAITLASPTYDITDWLLDDPQATGKTPVKTQGGQSAHGGQGQTTPANQNQISSAAKNVMTSASNQLTNRVAEKTNQLSSSVNQFVSDVNHEPVMVSTANQLQQSIPVAKPRGAPPTKERLPRPEAVFEPIESRQAGTTFQSSSTPVKPPRTAGEKRLLVKVIKASGLGPKETGAVEPVCLLLLDDPVQNYSTSAVKNTINPFWDEHFLFDVTQDTRELRLEVYDRAKSPGEEFIGESIVYIDDLRRTPSTRQILALQNRPGLLDNSTGALTVEFLFMDPSEADLLLDISAAASNQISPKRRIETGRTVTPGGTVVTTTTTTTEKSPYGNQDPGLDGSPHLVQKRLVNPDVSGSEYSDRSCSPLVITNDSSLSASSELIVVNGMESVSDAAIRELSDRAKRPRTPTKTSTLVITGVKRVRSRSQSLLSLNSSPNSPRSKSRSTASLTSSTDDLSKSFGADQTLSRSFRVERNSPRSLRSDQNSTRSLRGDGNSPRSFLDDLNSSRSFSDDQNLLAPSDAYLAWNIRKRVSRENLVPEEKVGVDVSHKLMPTNQTKNVIHTEV